MDCTRVEAELAPFLLAALDGPTRAAVEMHLVGCSRCVGELLAVKRAVDASEDAGEGPSDLARARILKAAEQKLAELTPTELTPADDQQAKQKLAEEKLAKQKLAELTPTEQKLAEQEPAPQKLPPRRRAPKLVVAAALLAMGALLPLAWRAARHPLADQPAPPSSGFAPPPLVTPERVDTASTTPDSLRFL